MSLSQEFEWNNFFTKFFYSDSIGIINETTGVHFFNDGFSVFLIINGNKLYGFGKKHVCLNGADKEDTIVPVEIKDINNSGIDSLCTGKEHTVLLDNNGEVFCWGDNKCGQIGCGNKQVSRTAPYKLPLPKITQISCGSSFTLALSCDHEVWWWGTMKDGYAYNCTPIKAILPAANIRSISAGRTHATVLDDKGTVYTWGTNDIGSFVYGATEINVPFKVIQVVAFHDHHFFMANNSYCFSSNNTGKISKIDLGPCFLSEITAVATTYLDYKVGIVSSDGLVYEINFNQEDQFINVTVTTRTSDIYRMFTTTPTLRKCQISPSFKGMGIMPFIKNKASCTNNSDFFNVNNCSDLIIKFKNDQLFAHKLVLIKQSSYFKKLFEDNTKCNLKELDVSNWSPEPYKGYIKYLYTGSLDVELDCLPEVYLLADQDENDELKSLCMDRWLAGMTKDNIIQLYHAAFVHNVKVMMNACGPILLRHLSELLSSEQINNIPANAKFALVVTAALHRK